MSHQLAMKHEDEPLSLEFFTFLTELIQLYTLSRKPRVFELRGPKRATATICLAENSIQHAEVGDLEGEEAFFEIATWGHGEIVKQRETLSEKRSIDPDRQLSNILMDAYWHAEEAAVQRANHPKALLAPENDDEARNADSAFQRADTQPGIAMIEDSLLASQLIEEIGLGEDTLDPTDDSLSAIEEFQMVWRKRLAWGERIGNELADLDGLVVYHIFDRQGTPLNTSDDDDATDDIANRQLPAQMIRALEALSVLEDHIELTLTLPKYHHIIMSIASAPNFLLHALFERENVTLAMAHWNLSKILTESGN